MRDSSPGTNHLAPRVIESGPTLFWVMAVTNVDAEPAPALGLFLSQSNFEMELGRLSYDGADHVVPFEIDLLGNSFVDDDLAYAMRFVAAGADEFDDHILNLFGGSTFNPEDEAGPPPTATSTKGGAGGYL